MGGGKVPGPLVGAGSGPVDDGTLNRQASPPPGPTGGNRDDKPWGQGDHRKLVEFNPDPSKRSGAERLRWKHLGYDNASKAPTTAEYQSWFEGFRLPKGNVTLLLPNPGFQPTPFERAFNLTFATAHPQSYPILTPWSEVVGHVAYFTNPFIFYPRRFSVLKLDDAVDGGVPAFVRQKNPNSDFWREASAQTGYYLAVTPDGEIISVLSSHGLDGVTSASTFSFILDVIMLVDGFLLVRKAFSAAGRALVDRELAKRAMAAAERERLEAAGKAATSAKNTTPAAYARTQPAEAFAKTVPKPADAVPKMDGGTQVTGDFSQAARDSALEKQFGDMNRETLEEIEKARAVRGSAAAEGDDWMEEVSDIITRVGKKHFPKGVPLD